MSDGGEMSRIAGVEDIVRADRPIPMKGRYGDRYRDRYRGGGGGGGRTMSRCRQRRGGDWKGSRETERDGNWHIKVT